jgi:hypothetical protein
MRPVDGGKVKELVMSALREPSGSLNGQNVVRERIFETTNAGAYEMEPSDTKRRWMVPGLVELKPREELPVRESTKQVAEGPSGQVKTSAT